MWVINIYNIDACFIQYKICPLIFFLEIRYMNMSILEHTWTPIYLIVSIDITSMVSCGFKCSVDNKVFFLLADKTVDI